MTADRPEPRASGEAWATQGLASAWQSGAAARGEAMAAVTELLLDLAGVTAGSRVLDVGAGTGDQTLVAAQRVGPDGLVLATDPAATMLSLAAEAFRAAGLQNVETRVMGTENLDLESGSFDAVIARNSLQFVPDLQQGLAEVRRVLKPGGRFASLSWSTTETNPFRAIPHSVASRAAGQPFPEPGPAVGAPRRERAGRSVPSGRLPGRRRAGGADRLALPLTGRCHPQSRGDVPSDHPVCSARSASASARRPGTRFAGRSSRTQGLASSRHRAKC